ncbi:hypothetical protein CK203_092626 [Vitis vinifera]|uniref:30S ribosomal protein S15, chloroplastic n=1 Tax=Vitis vinifera TaxID=29760 RepID=A0A438BV67_VITVI|nr:hypothetical protein CK203_092626 [Vitis vinifera]
MYMQYFHPDNMSSAEKLKVELKKVRDEFKMSESDCGSARVQVAQLTTKIKHLNSALHKKELFPLHCTLPEFSLWRCGCHVGPVHEVKGKLLGKILESSRCYSSWIRFGELGLSPLLEEVELCCWGVGGKPFSKERLEGEVNLSLLRGALILFELDSIEDASEVLHRGLRRFANKCLSLGRWLLEVGCFRRDIHAKEASRVWDKTLFKYLRDCHGGFVLVDISIVKQRNLQWARILVGSNDKNIPRLLQVVVGLFCYLIQLWWEVPLGCHRDILSLGAIRCHKVRKVAGGFEKPLLLGYYDGGCGLADLGLVLLEDAHCKKDNLVPLERDQSEGCEKGFWLNILASQERRNLEEGAPFVDATLLFGVEGFAGKLSSPVCWMGDGFSSASSISKDEGPAKSLVLWREQDKGLVVECKGDGYGMLYVGSEKVVALENGSSRRDSMGDESLYDLSFGKFVSFSKFLDLLVEGYEKEIVSLLRKLEAKKGYRVVALSIKRRPSSMSDFDRELCKLECLVNYNKSSGKGGSQKWGWDMVCCHCIVVSNCYKMNDHVLFMHVMVFKMQDKHSRKGLQAMVQRRKKLLKYLRRTDWDSYCLVLSKLGLRDNPNYKN